jgi:hypothetical protein
MNFNTPLFSILIFVLKTPTMSKLILFLPEEIYLW